MSSWHVMFDGKLTLDNVTAIHFASRLHFPNVVQAIRWVRTTGCSWKAVHKLKGNAAIWAMHCFPICLPIKWTTCCWRINTEDITCNVFDQVKPEWKEHSLSKGGHVIELDISFCFVWLKIGTTPAHAYQNVRHHYFVQD